MNVYRIVGLIIFVAGIVLKQYTKNTAADFFFGAMVGSGIALVIASFKKSKKTDE